MATLRSGESEYLTSADVILRNHEKFSDHELRIMKLMADTYVFFCFSPGGYNEFLECMAAIEIRDPETGRLLKWNMDDLESFLISDAGPLKEELKKSSGDIDIDIDTGFLRLPPWAIVLWRYFLPRGLLGLETVAMDLQKNWIDRLDPEYVGEFGGILHIFLEFVFNCWSSRRQPPSDPTTYIIMNMFYGIVKVLAARKVNFNIRHPRTGLTPLEYASSADIEWKSAMLLTLIELGAEVTRRVGLNIILSEPGAGPALERDGDKLRRIAMEVLNDADKTAPPCFEEMLQIGGVLAGNIHESGRWEESPDSRRLLENDFLSRFLKDCDELSLPPCSHNEIHTILETYQSNSERRLLRLKEQLERRKREIVQERAVKLDVILTDAQIVKLYESESDDSDTSNASYTDFR
ncbi:hypothetical protein ABW19_dt0209611 [Dactylella cylindrospora]|nr:hypothetical protein ABW19_dt0209611 [Dactylella cylindrospora]